MITISNVNLSQRAMLDHMWSFNDYDDLEEWKDTLDDEDRDQAELLEQMIMLAVLDEIIDETEENFKEANDIINSITKKLP